MEIRHAHFPMVDSSSREPRVAGRRREYTDGAGEPGSACQLVIRVTSGLSQKSARPAATRSQAIAAQKTGVHDPVTSTSHAAPTPAKIDAVPFAVY